jgi:hypothetical protein
MFRHYLPAVINNATVCRKSFLRHFTPSFCIYLQQAIQWNSIFLKSDCYIPFRRIHICWRLNSTIHCLQILLKGKFDDRCTSISILFVFPIALVRYPMRPFLCRYSGSDIKLVCKEAAMRVVRRVFDVLESDLETSALPKYVVVQFDQIIIK